MSNKVQANSDTERRYAEKNGISKEKGSRKGLRRQSVMEARSKWDFQSMQSMFAKSKSSVGNNTNGNKYSDFIADVNQYISLQYSSKNPSINMLDTSDPHQDKTNVKIAECVTGEDIAKQLKNSCCSYDGQLLATWNTQSVSLLNLENDVNPPQMIPVNFETLAEPSQVFFMPDCKHLAIVEYQEIKIYKTAPNELVKTYKLPKDKDGDNQDDIEPLIFNHFVSIQGVTPRIGECHDRYPLILVLCDDYYFYYVSLRKESGVDSHISDQIHRYSIPFELKDFRGSDFYIPIGNQRYITIKYDTTKEVPTTVVTVWKTDIDFKYNSKSKKYQRPEDSDCKLTMAKRFEESNMQISCIDKQRSTNTCRRLWVYDSNRKVHLWMRWTKENNVTFEKIIDKWGDLEPTSIETRSNGDFAFVQSGHRFIYLLGYSEGAFHIIFTHKIQQESCTLAPYNLDKLIVRQSTCVFYYSLDFPPTYRAELLNLPDQQCSVSTSSLLCLDNGILVSVDAANKNIYHKHHKNSPLNSGSLLGVASQKNKLLKTPLKDCKAIKDSTQAVFLFANRDTYVGVYFDIQIMTVDFSQAEPECISLIEDPKTLQQVNCFSIGPDGRAILISHKNGLTIYYTDESKAPVTIKGAQGRGLLIRPPVGEEYLMVWNSLDNEVQFSCCFNYYNPSDPIEPPGEECPLNIVVDYKYFKLSEGRSTLVLYGKEGFCVLDTASKQYKLHAPEGVFDLGEHCVEISPDGNLLAVHSSIENQAYLYCIKTLQRQSLGECHSIKKYMTFAFIDYLNKLVVYDTFKDKLRFFSKKELAPVEFPTYMKVGEQGLPSDSRLVSMVVNEKSLVTFASFPTHMHVLLKIRLPLNNVNNLNMFLIRRQISKYFSTDLVDKKASRLNKIIRLVSLNPTHSLILHPIFTIIVYMLNNHQGFCEYCSLFGNPEILFYRHNLLDMYFTINMKESMSGVLHVMKNFNSKHQRYPEIDVKGTVLMINTLKRKLLTDKLREEMLTLLIFAPYFEKIVGDLEEEQYAMAVYEPPVATRESEQNLLKSDCIKTSLRTILKPDPVNLQDMLVYESLIPLDMATGSDFSRAFFSMVTCLSRDNIKTKFKTVIYQKWSKVQPYALSYAFLLWIMNILLYVYLGYHPESRELFATIIAFNVFFIIFEIKCACSATLSYFKDKWNYVDIIAQAFSIIICSVCFGTPPSELSVAKSYLKVICVILMGFRSITWLRVFQSTRYLITMVLEVFIDVIPFLVILISASLLTSFAWLVLPHLGHVTVDMPKMNFFASVIIPIDMIFGNGPGNSVEASGAQFWLILLSNAVLTLVFLNFLIALISGTFERISQDKDLYDVMELLYIIKDFDAFLSGISLTFRKIFRKKTLKTELYYISVIPFVAEDSTVAEVQKMIEGLEDRQKKDLALESSSIISTIQRQSMAMREEVKREISQNLMMFQEVQREITKNDQNWSSFDKRLSKLESMIQRLVIKMSAGEKKGDSEWKQDELD